MTNDELMARAINNTAGADQNLRVIHEQGHIRQVDPMAFTTVLRALREATAAVTELERRARGGEAPKVG